MPSTAHESKLVTASFVARPNRFIVRARLTDGGEVDAHLGDPGRLEDLLLEEAPLRLLPASGQGRRTAFTVALVQSPTDGAWVSVETTRANRLAEPLLRDRAIQGLPRYTELKREARAGKSRFDFRLETERGPFWVEVKSVTFADDGVGRFPDAPTARGRRHLEELTERVRSGEQAMVLFVVQRGDVRSVTPYTAIDPAFTEALVAAHRAGVLLRAARFRLDVDGRADPLGAVPVRLPHRS